MCNQNQILILKLKSREDVLQVDFEEIKLLVPSLVVCDG